MKLPELLMPAGDLQKAYYAFRYWADAVYCWVPMFALRTRMNVFSEKDILEIVDFAHKNWKKVYITLNWFPHQNMIKALRKHLEFLAWAGPDWIILADAWVLELANEICPEVPKHLSVQASTVSESWIRFWAKNWVKRIILAREISIKEVSKIHEMFPEMELEYFVHWAVCMAYSWRCLLSNFMAQRDANRWMCAHSCRWNYKIFDEEGREMDLTEREKREERLLPWFIPDSINWKPLSIRDFEATQIWEEELRKGEYIPVEQDIHGTHIMSSRDMCMVEHLQEVIDSWVCSLKVEWRNKTIYYLSSVARAYRKALDDIENWKKFDDSLWNEIHATANRWFFAWFLHWKPRIEGQQYEANRSTATQEFCWAVLRFFKRWEVLEDNLFWFPKGYKFLENMILFDVKNRIDSWSNLTFIYPKISDDKKILIKNLYKNWEKVEVVHGWDWNAWIWLWDSEVMEWVLIRQDVKNSGLKN